ncbi:hypothetical protein [uncultured Campylobacter sp.]|uniref:hypothetical protein n=1 Tax=uncultured Campylobacter sp. TaxID=218934 RepID=UPI0026039727|nr:hypothetical protein [uncultured Campylobacter sp.]
MMVDNFLARYNSQLNTNLLNKVKEADDAKSKEEEKKFDEALKEQTDAFEAFMIKTVLDVSLQDKVSIFEKDKASDEIYSSMYNDAMSKALSGGMGFSELLFNFLKERS